MIRAAILSLFLLLPVAWAQPEITGRREYPAHALVRLQVANVPDKVGFLWRVSPPVIDRATTSKDRLEFAAPPGVYDVEVLLFSIAPDGTPSLDSVQTRVVVGAIPPGPTPPGPTPPGPIPPIPPPDDLTRELKQLYDADTTSNKQKVGKQLATLYQFGVQAAADKAYATSGELDVALYKRAKDSVENGLDTLRQRVADKCKAVLGGSDPKLVLTDDKRKALVDLFGRLAKAMEEIAK